MAFIIMVLIGVGLTVSNANGWFAVPDYCIWICFGIAVLLALVSVVNYVSAKRTFNKTSNRMHF